MEEFQAVLDAAKAVLENEDATIEEIREAVENLQKASNKLGTVRDPYVRLEAEDYDGGDVVKTSTATAAAAETSRRQERLLCSVQQCKLRRKRRGPCCDELFQPGQRCL